MLQTNLQATARTAPQVVDYSLVSTPKKNIFILTVEVGHSTVRPRTVDFVVDEYTAKALVRLNKLGRADDQFGIAATGETEAFMPVERVFFDVFSSPGTVYRVRDIRRIALIKF